MKPLLLLCLLMAGCSKQSTADNKSEYYRGKADGIEWAVNKFVDHEMILSPTNSPGNFSNCLFITVIRPAPLLKLEGTNNIRMYRCYFLGSSGWAHDVAIEVDAPKTEISRSTITLNGTAN